MPPALDCESCIAECTVPNLLTSTPPSRLAIPDLVCKNQVLTGRFWEQVLQALSASPTVQLAVAHELPFIPPTGLTCHLAKPYTLKP